jgi:hypothetical protein
MTDDSAGTDQRGERRQYIKPFVRNIDMSDTEGKLVVDPTEAAFTTPFGPS